MGMSTHVYGIVPPDEQWQKMKKVYDACQAAKVEVPDEVEEFFGHEPPDPKGVVMNLEEHECCQEFSDKNRPSDGYIVDATKLPEGVKLIRFVNSY